MKKMRFGSMILISLTLGLLTVFTVSANALQISIHFGPPPPPPPPPLRYTAPPEPVYVEFHSDVVLHLSSAYFSLDYPVVYAYQRDYGLTPDEVVYVLYLSHYTRRSPVYVINIYRSRHDWSIVTRELRLPPDAPRWMREKNAPSIAVLHATSAYYGVPYTRIQEIHQKGYRPAGNRCRSQCIQQIWETGR